MSSQPFSTAGMPAQSNPGGKPVSINQSSNQTGPGEDSSGDVDHHGPQDLPASSRGGQEALSFREDKQETGVVRPYPQVPVQTHSLQSQVPALSQQVPNKAGTPGQPVTVSNLPVQLLQAQPAALVDGQMKAALKSLVPSRLIAPASNQVQGGHIPLPLPLKVQPALLGHITVTLESHMAPTSSIPVATISGQQGHSSNRHHLMPANIQIIRAPSVPQHTFSSHLPRGAVAAAVMSSCKGPAVLRPASGASVGPVQHTVHHITHQSIQSRSPVTSSTAVAPISATRNQSPVTSSTAVAPISATRNQSPVTSSTAVAPISATRNQSPVINPTFTQSAEVLHGHPGLTIHPLPATISIQRPQGARDTATRITLPSHPAIGGQKPQPPHTMTQKSIFCSGTPVAAATVAPILTNTVPGTTTTGTAPHTQVTSGTIITMTMPSHSSHATALTTSTIPVAKVVPQPIAHTSPRVQSDYLGERTNLIQPIAHTSPHVQSDYQPIAHTSPRVQSDYPVERTNLISISGNRSSPNPVTIEARSDNRPVHFQYFLPTFSSSPYPRTHTYTPITSSVSTIRQYPVTPQTPSSTLPSQPAVAVPTTLHLNPMQLMAVDRIGLQSAQISTQGIQPQPMGAQGIQPAPMGVQGLHSSGPIGTQGIQQAPIAGQQPEAKPSGMVLADGSPFGATQPVATMVQTHPQGGVGGGAPTLVSSPRPSILRKKPANEGCVVGKTLIPAVPGEAHSGRVEGGVRGAGQPRAAGVKPKAEVHMTMVAPPVLVMAAVEALPSQGGAERQTVSSPAQQHLSQAIPSNLLAPRGPPPPSQPSSTAHLSALPAAMAVTPTGPASMANTVASPTQPAASSTAACSGGSAHTEVKIKQEAESMEMYQPVPQSSANSGLSTQPHQAGSLHGAPSSGDLVPGASPRKKPRKQQHVISTEETEMLETNSTDEDRAMGHRPLGSRAKRRESPPREYVDEEGVRYVPVRPRPPVTLLRHYRNPWKAAYHHFQRYSDIRIKEEKESLQDVANQRGVARRAQGWRMHLCVAQLMQLSNLEHDVYSRLTSLQEGLIPKKRAGVDNELHRINELIQGNMQRCKLVMDQVTEARDTMMKVLDHKDKVLKLLNQNGDVKKSNKLKRKDRA
ncbi:histone deacetylase complex subunit SAP130-like isoform X2 [Salvelinus namaycush]|uniref:Histone deacetylase complex subunit SAP130-like isoform X2 n=1 Tax=Salvelinus namaycush TaxID=8040 RepID=A0A8U1BTV0_SALNM|nr:histone deacetylase complex subunit SAP130-like isoform X2 [Salvelinus namaycush]